MSAAATKTAASAASAATAATAPKRADAEPVEAQQAVAGHDADAERAAEGKQSAERKKATSTAAAAPALESATQPAQRDHIERDVSNILAGLNQEQLASIVAAARASEARNAGTATNLPLGLGQAASALTSIAAGFKRTPGNDRTSLGTTTDAAAKNVGNASTPSTTGYSAQAPNGETKDLDADTTAAIAAVKSATDTATAAAIASLGSLATASQLQQQQASTSSQSHATNADDSVDHHSRNGSASPSRGLKRARGPELDRQRKDNHKEVERRRRSAINDGITQLSHIVPGCDAKNTNKGAIINAAVRYIQDLKHNEASNIEKWTLEKLLMDQAMGDLTAQLEEARAQIDTLRAELDQLDHPQAEAKS